MQKFFILGIIVFAFMTTVDALGQDHKVMFDKNFSHVVYFWLNNPENTEEEKCWIKQYYWGAQKLCIQFS